MDNNKRIVGAFSKIEEVLNEIRDLLPESKAPIKITVQKNQPHAQKILKRVWGIIKNYNEENSERKLQNLFKLLQGLNKTK